MSLMAKQTYRRTFIRQWRTFRRLSLRQLASRLEVDPGGDPLISYAQLQRIELGEQPYSQPIIEAIAAALTTSVRELLEVDPRKEGQVVDLLTEMRNLTEDQKRRALIHIQAVKQAG